MELNRNFARLSSGYLFSDVGRRVAAFAEKHPDVELTRLGIGDVTLPLAEPVVQAMCRAAREMGTPEGFHGYGPEQGYSFARQAVQAQYAQRGVVLLEEEIFLSDGAKSDLGGLMDLFGPHNIALVPDPGYPVYADTSVMAGHPVRFVQGTQANGFLPGPDGQTGDIVYLCSPGNPTGAVYTREGLTAWVEYALERGAVILFDAAYESFIQDDTLPHSIFEIEGARRCAVEIGSLSKTAGFTGTRFGYTVIPQELECQGIHLRDLWLRRQSTKCNGVSYPVQRAAQAALSEEGRAACRKAVAYYLDNAHTLRAALEGTGVFCCGGDNSPYVWMQCPGGMDSWQFFEYLLKNARIVGTPGAGFGPGGEGYFRLTGFGERTATRAAAERLRAAVLAAQK
ncbi:LL-diaminopimelate aminotransferase [uncultured Ruthenibacterium sp.]|uniref:LL-diaminopimelate aminotransferase n=1 Tax=uncultured Ruthenibacterium sp. TaxID=1905347 RepID=UPI00349EB196